MKYIKALKQVLATNPSNFTSSYGQVGIRYTYPTASFIEPGKRYLEGQRLRFTAVRARGTEEDTQFIYPEKELT